MYYISVPSGNNDKKPLSCVIDLQQPRSACTRQSRITPRCTENKRLVKNRERERETLGNR